jgi:hypothetical protein
MAIPTSPTAEVMGIRVRLRLGRRLARRSRWTSLVKSLDGRIDDLPRGAA